MTPATEILLREESPGDATAIHALTEAAFRDAEHRSGSEAFIVDALRRDGQLSVSQVALCEDGTIIGHAAASPITIDGNDAGWFGLGPVSVLPAWQGRGIGARLVEAVIAELREQGAAGCVALGDPRYYARFGFCASPSLVLPDVPAQYFQSLPFGDATPPGRVAYADAFSATE